MSEINSRKKFMKVLDIFAKFKYIFHIFIFNVNSKKCCWHSYIVYKKK